MMKKFGFILIFALMIAAPAQALDTELGFGGFAALNLGLTAIDMSGMNDYLRPANVSDFSSVYAAVGGEVYGVVYDRFIFGGSGAFSARQETGDDLTAQLYLSNLALEVGYLLVDIKGFRIYPMFGLGLNTTVVDLEGYYTTLPLAEQAGAKSVTLSNAGSRSDGTATMTTKDSVELSHGAMIAQGSLHFDYIHPFVKSNEGFAFYLLGLRAGVTGEIASTGWALDGESLEGKSPNVDQNTFFLRLAFGFGGGTSTENALRAQRRYDGYEKDDDRRPYSGGMKKKSDDDDRADRGIGSVKKKDDDRNNNEDRSKTNPGKKDDDRSKTNPDKGDGERSKTNPAAGKDDASNKDHGKNAGVAGAVKKDDDKKNNKDDADKKNDDKKDDDKDKKKDKDDNKDDKKKDSDKSDDDKNKKPPKD